MSIWKGTSPPALLNFSTLKVPLQQHSAGVSGTARCKIVAEL